MSDAFWLDAVNASMGTFFGAIIGFGSAVVLAWLQRRRLKLEETMRYVLLFALLLLGPISGIAVAAESGPTNASSAVADSARFQIVQSPILVKLTFRLDRFTGNTWQYVAIPGGGVAWQPIPRVEIVDDTKVTGRVNYQIFLSGVLASVSLLVNTNTGASWVLTEDPKQGLFWSPIK